jgi:hypothetical protein
MKKFVAIALFALVSVAFSFADPVSDFTTVLGTVAQHLSVEVSDLNFGEIDYAAGESGDITITARANVKSWKLSATAIYGKLTWGGATAWTTADETTQIPYTVALKDGEDTVLFAAAALVQATNTDLETFARKTTGGADGEDFTLTVDVAAPSATDDWVYGVYKEEIQITVTAL